MEGGRTVVTAQETATISTGVAERVVLDADYLLLGRCGRLGPSLLPSQLTRGVGLRRSHQSKYFLSTGKEGSECARWNHARANARKKGKK